MEEAGVDHEGLLDTYIRAINVCVENRPRDLRIGVHMCRGNFKVLSSRWAPKEQKLTRAPKGGVHFSEGGYGRIAAKVFKRLDVDTFYVSGGSACLRYIDRLKYSSWNMTQIGRETSSH